MTEDLLGRRVRVLRPRISVGENDNGVHTQKQHVGKEGKIVAAYSCVVSIKEGASHLRVVVVLDDGHFYDGWISCLQSTDYPPTPDVAKESVDDERAKYMLYGSKPEGTVTK